MAIFFLQPLSETQILNSSNNNIVWFSSTNGASKKCVISINGFDFEITPDKNGFFIFDFKSVVSVLSSGENREDLYLANGDFNEYPYGINIMNVEYIITLENDTTDSVIQSYIFSNIVEQIGEYTVKEDSDIHLFNPNVLTLFKGFPFDISLYANQATTLLNQSKGYSKEYDTSAKNSYRIEILSDLLLFKQRIYEDGATYEVNDCYDGDNYDLLNDGINELKLTSATNSIDFKIKVSDRCSGTYLKWQNYKGGWSYWLFNPIYKENQTTKTKDIFNAIEKNQPYQTDTQLITGKDSSLVRSFSEKNLDIDDVNLIKSILDSPRVEMFNGVKDDLFGNINGDTQDDFKWQAVTVRDGSFEISNTKRNFHNLNLSININKFSLL